MRNGELNIKDRLGEVRENNFGTPMKIIKYRKASDLDVQFLDEHRFVKEHITYSRFKLGQVKNPYDKSMYGIGYLGIGQHKASINCIHTQENDAWKCMIERCYCGERKEHMSYFKNCTVCEEWFNYQNFAEWYSNNKYDVDGRLHLDKDILMPGNTLYAPDRCLLVPQKINEQFHYSPKNNGLPTGVRSAGDRYSAFCNSKNLGTYATVEEAHKAYSREKERIIKQVADEYKDIVPLKVYEVLYSYKVKLENDKCYMAA